MKWIKEQDISDNHQDIVLPPLNEGPEDSITSIFKQFANSISAKEEDMMLYDIRNQIIHFQNVFVLHVSDFEDENKPTAEEFYKVAGLEKLTPMEIELERSFLDVIDSNEYKIDINFNIKEWILPGKRINGSGRSNPGDNSKKIFTEADPFVS